MITGRISLIVSFARNRIIGQNNKMPWRLPDDLAWFKRHTLNKPVIMGRRTFESLEKPLPDRHNIVISHQLDCMDCRVTWADSISVALAYAGVDKEIMVIGGEQIYKQFMPIASRLYITKVSADVEGDTYFPDYTSYNWVTVFHESHHTDKRHFCNYSFEILDRKD